MTQVTAGKTDKFFIEVRVHEPYKDAPHICFIPRTWNGTVGAVEAAIERRQYQTTAAARHALKRYLRRFVEGV